MAEAAEATGPVQPVFYDIHCHVLTMDHPSLAAIAARYERPIRGFAEKASRVKWIICFLLGVIGLLFGARYVSTTLTMFSLLVLAICFCCMVLWFRLRGCIRKVEPVLEGVRRVLDAMASPIGYTLIEMQDQLTPKDEPFFGANGCVVGGRTYPRIVLTPLVMDFGYLSKNNRDELILNKAVETQFEDLAQGIEHYNAYCEWNGKRIFEIYPFIGVNPRLFDTPALVTTFLNRYLGPQATIHAAGVKVYPPLGFDPWPDPQRQPVENGKVRALYDFCIKCDIPITSHCSDGGFAVAKNPHELTNPAKWRSVLGQYPKLRLNLAHMGKQSDGTRAWRNEVIELVTQYPNVYTDISYCGIDEKFYQEVEGDLARAQNGPPAQFKLEDKVLFGSDYLINLLDEGSYSGYLCRFKATLHLNPDLKHKICSTNPVRFLGFA